MKSLNVVATVVLSTLLVAPATYAATPDASAPLDRAQQDAAAGRTTQAFDELELSMSLGAGSDPKSWGRAEAQYWPLIQQADDYSRAMNFFMRLASEHPRSPDVLGTEGSAIGGYIGWLARTGQMDLFGRERVAALGATARSAFDRALALDPDNFTALLGYAIFESYSPGGSAHAQQLFNRLDALRSSHPEYPWQIVERAKQHRL